MGVVYKQQTFKRSPDDRRPNSFKAKSQGEYFNPTLSNCGTCGIENKIVDVTDSTGKILYHECTPCSYNNEIRDQRFNGDPSQCVCPVGYVRRLLDSNCVPQSGDICANHASLDQMMNYITKLSN